MQSRVKDLLGIGGVKGAVLFTLSGQRVCAEFTVGHDDVGNTGDWFAIAACVDNAREAELVFERARLYIRRSTEGVLVVVMGLLAPTGMIRLTSDVLLSGMRAQAPVRGIRRFFKR
jgi:hypothetical protein